MTLVKLLRRKIPKSACLLLTFVFMCYFMLFLMENTISKVSENNPEEYEIKLQRAIEENQRTQKQEHNQPLEPAQNYQNDQIPQQIPPQNRDKENKGNFLPPVDEKIKPDQLEKGDGDSQWKVETTDKNQIDGDSQWKNDKQVLEEKQNRKHENNIDNNPQINPPVKEPPKVDVKIKPGLGEYGVAVNISRELLSVEEKKEYDEGWKNNAFNEFLSRRISVNRTLVDPRDEKCKLMKYSDNLPAASVILTVHNEAWTVLLRSVHSIINRTPEKLLKEIILVDDFSDMEHLGRPLEKYMFNFPKVKIVRLPERQGLIRARLAGYRVATAEILVFLDSHIECTEGWYEPMADRIKQNWTNVLTPSIDVIKDDTFELFYTNAKGTSAGGFDWNLVFTWHGIPEAERKRRNYDDHLPFRSPTMAGGLFAINRNYFTYIGTYDEGMDIWGAENLEISFRIWMCGGTLETAPCSHIGHIFRKRSPYKWRGNVNVLWRNNVRLAEVWLDDYKKYYYDRFGYNLGDYGNITSRVELRKKLKCKSFDWFLRHVYPEMWVPGESKCFGQIRAKTIPQCLSGVCDYGQTGKPLTLFNCSHGGQYWYMTLSNEIKRDYGCLDYSGKPDIQVESCHQMGGNQKWEYREDNTIFHPNFQKCLEISQDGKTLFMNTCLGTDYQIWLWNRERPDGPTRNWNLVD